MVKCREVDRVVLLAGGGDDAEGLGIDHLRAAIGALADLAHADAAIHTGGAHAADGHYGIFGAVLGQRCC